MLEFFYLDDLMKDIKQDEPEEEEKTENQANKNTVKARICRVHHQIHALQDHLKHQTVIVKITILMTKAILMKDMVMVKKK